MKPLVGFTIPGLVACGWIYGSDNVQTLAAIYMWVMGSLLIVLSLFGIALFNVVSTVDSIPKNEDFLNKSIVKNSAMQLLVFSLAIFNCWLAFENDYVVTSVVYGVSQVMGFMFIQSVKTKMIGE